MFIIFGWDNTAKPQESLLTAPCAHCKVETNWTLWKQTTWGSLFFIKLIPIIDSYYLRCDKCGDTIKLDNKTAKAALDKSQRSDALHNYIVETIQKTQL